MKKKSDKKMLFEMMGKVNPDYKQNFFNLALQQLKELNEKYHHLTDQELIDIANAEPMRFVELDSYQNSEYYGGIITDDLEFFEEKYEEEEKDVFPGYGESIDGSIVNVNGKPYYYYIAGGYD